MGKTTITEDEWSKALDDALGPMPEADQSAMTVYELVEHYEKQGRGVSRSTIERQVKAAIKAGTMEAVKKSNGGRMVNAYRPAKKGETR